MLGQEATVGSQLTGEAVGLLASRDDVDAALALTSSVCKMESEVLLGRKSVQPNTPGHTAARTGECTVASGGVLRQAYFFRY